MAALNVWMVSLLSGLLGALVVPVVQYFRDKHQRTKRWDYYRKMLDDELNLLWFDFTAIFPESLWESLDSFVMVTTVWDIIWKELPEFAPQDALDALGSAYTSVKTHQAHLDRRHDQWKEFRQIEATRARIIDAINVLGVRKWDESEGTKGFQEKYGKELEEEIKQRTGMIQLSVKANE